MPNPRWSRKRKRRYADLQPHERAFLTGEPQDKMNAFGIIRLHCRPVSVPEIERRADMIAKYRRLIPAERRPIIDRWYAYWCGDLQFMDNVGENVRL